jgi:hypothetical protein
MRPFLQICEKVVRKQPQILPKLFSDGFADLRKCRFMCVPAYLISATKKGQGGNYEIATTEKSWARGVADIASTRVSAPCLLLVCVHPRPLS